MIHRLFSGDSLSDSKLLNGLLVGLSMVMAVSLSPPILSQISGNWVSFAYLPFHQLCHQMAERSFAVNGIPLAICARCLGIFTGLWVALVVLTIGLPYKKFMLLTRVSIYLFMAVLSVNFIQFFIEISTGAVSGNLVRYILGLGLGVHVILVIYSRSATLTNSYIHHGTASKTDIL